MYVSKVGYSIGVTIKRGPNSFNMDRPGGYVEVTLNEGEDVDRAIQIAREESIKIASVASNDCNTIHSIVEKYEDQYPTYMYYELVDRHNTSPEPGDDDV